MSDVEIWKSIAGYEGRYEISNLGRVKSLPNSRRKSEAILSPGDNGSGYLHVNLSLNGKSKCYRIHLLVLEAFEGERPGGSFEFHGCHNDGNTKNNRLDNLEWKTASRNQRDKIRHGTITNGEKNGQSKLTQEDVLQIRRRASLGEKLVDIAQSFGVQSPQITRIVKRERWAHI